MDRTRIARELTRLARELVAREQTVIFYVDGNDPDPWKMSNAFYDLGNDLMDEGNIEDTYVLDFVEENGRTLVPFVIDRYEGNVRDVRKRVEAIARKHRGKLVRVQES